MQMTYKQLYKLTPRSFSNALDGYRKKEDTLSRERWLVTRKIMFATMKPYLPSGVEETDIIQFPWEEKQLKLLSEEKAEEAKKDIERIENFWDNYDKNKIAKA